MSKVVEYTDADAFMRAAYGSRKRPGKRAQKPQTTRLPPGEGDMLSALNTLSVAGWYCYVCVPISEQEQQHYFIHRDGRESERCATYRAAIEAVRDKRGAA